MLSEASTVLLDILDQLSTDGSSMDESITFLYKILERILEASLYLNVRIEVRLSNIVQNTPLDEVIEYSISEVSMHLGAYKQASSFISIDYQTPVQLYQAMQNNI